MSLYRRALQRIGRTRWFAWLGRHVLTRIDKLAGTRFPTPTTIGTGLPLLHLVTTGRTSGEPRSSPLLYLEDGPGLVVAGTNFGTRHHPGWSYNLDAVPEATVQRKGRDPLPVTSRRATTDEIAGYWPRFAEMWAGYDAYRERARATGMAERIHFLCDNHGSDLS